MKTTRTLVAVLWAVLVWTTLWGDVSLGNLLAGVAVGLLTVLVAPVQTGGLAHPVALRPGAALHFVGFFLWSLVKSSAVVAWEVLTPGSRIHQGIVRVPLQTRSRGITTLVANAISLTPGTLTIEVDEDPFILYVHVLHLREVESVRRDLGRVEELARRAFDPEPRVQESRP